MKKYSFLINAARGQLINEKDLLDALKTNTIGGAGLDVMADNIPPIDHPFFSLDNILITPHIAFFSQEATIELEERAAGEVVRVYQGVKPETLVNKDVLHHPSPRHKLSRKCQFMSYIIEILCPPSITKQDPVIIPALSEDKKATKSPRGSGQPNLPIGRLSSIKPSTTSLEFSD